MNELTDIKLLHAVAGGGIEYVSKTTLNGECGYDVILDTVFFSTLGYIIGFSIGGPEVASLGVIAGAIGGGYLGYYYISQYCGLEPGFYDVEYVSY